MNNWRTIRWVLACMLALGLCTLIGCKKKEEQPSQQSITANSVPAPPVPAPPARTKPFASLTDRNAQPTVLATPPAGMFDLSAHPDASILTAININSLSDSEREFGIAPRRTKDVDYADGVIVMENGDKAIRSMSGNGMSWTFDASAEHVNEFQVGKIVFATGRAVGRILSLKQEGNSVTAFLGPVQLTDVIKRGHFAMSQKIDTDNMLTYVAPDFPQPPDELVGGATKTSSSYEEDGAHLERTVIISRVQHGRWTPTSASETFADGRRVTYRRVGSKWSQGQVSLANVSRARLANPVELARLSMPPEAGPEISTPPRMLAAAVFAGTRGNNVVNLDGDDVRVQPDASNSGIGLEFYYHKNGVNIWSECLLRVLGARVDFDLNITSQGIETAGVRIGGDLAIVMKAEAASEQNFNANLHKTVYEPIDFSIPLGLNGAAGVPFSVTFGSFLRLETGFSAKTSKLAAEGIYPFGGGIWAGMQNYQWSVSAAPHVQAEKDLGVTANGVSVGINSLVIAASIRAMVGIGAFGFNTGVFVQIIFNGTILRGSDVTSPIIGLPPCRQGTVGASLYYGIGYSMPKVFVELVNKILALFTSYRLAEEGDIMTSKPLDLFHGITQIPANCASQTKAGT